MLEICRFRSVAVALPATKVATATDNQAVFIIFSNGFSGSERCGLRAFPRV